MALSKEQINTLHLHARAGFGLPVTQLEDWSKMPVTAQVDRLFSESESFTPLTVIKDFGRPEKVKEMNDAERKKLRVQKKEELQQVNTAWMKKIFSDKAQLRERMTYFWHGHFACRTDMPWFAQALNNVLRKHALGSFKEMLKEVAKSPAMLQFLNNQQNRKQHPNENFARELLELFTIGRGNYSETDIREAARAFTGWSFDRETGEFRIREKAHDDDPKTFMGVTRNLGGEDIIEIVLAKPDTALFITRKICRFLVAENPEEKTIESLADSFLKSGYDIGALLKQILKSDWFYAETNRGCLIKSPVELLAGIVRNTGLTMHKEESLIYIQRMLGQVLFYPPNVAGWPGGKSWIDNSSLMLRLRLASLLMSNGVIEAEEKDDMPEEFRSNEEGGTATAGLQRRFETQFNWDSFIAGLPASWKRDELASFFLRAQPPSNILSLVSEVKDNASRKNALVQILSLPEYQLT